MTPQAFIGIPNCLSCFLKKFYVELLILITLDALILSCHSSLGALESMVPRAPLPVHLVVILYTGASDTRFRFKVMAAKLFSDFLFDTNL